MLPKPYLLFLGDVTGAPNAKTAFGVRDWAAQDVVGQWCLPGGDIDLGLVELTARQAVRAGARSLLIGAAPVGGALPATWVEGLVQALEAGLDLVSGLHDRLGEVPKIRKAADRLGRRLHDVRSSARRYPVASGRKRRGRRLLTVGTDCALGKKYAALAIAQAMKARGWDADFRATGQTGIMIAGDGVALDAVVADFIAGAAETLSPDADERHWDVIEGQGALFHPAYAGVTLGLVHGSQPDALIMCHDPSRKTLNMYRDYATPPLNLAMDRYLEAARLTNPAAVFVGISLNTSGLSPKEARVMMREIEEAHALPCFDPMISDLTPLMDRLETL